MARHQHTFVDRYDGMVGFGFSREVDEKSLMFYLQKISEDDLVTVLVPRLNDVEITDLFERLTQLMRKYLTDDEYHHLFLKDEQAEDQCD